MRYTRETPLLLTPGPLSTPPAVREAMQIDWGSWDEPFRALNDQIRKQLLRVAQAENTHEVVPLQGSGTFAVEAMLSNFVPTDGKVLLLTNGAYGKRAVQITQRLGRSHIELETAQNTPPDIGAVAAALDTDKAITHVFTVHCETTSGILNPVEQIAELCRGRGVKLLVDSMSGFGALTIDPARYPFEAMAAGANKSLHGAPGLAFVLCEKQALAGAKGRSQSLSLDLFDQAEYMARTRQWRFTPPTHIVAALHAALENHASEGGAVARRASYQEKMDMLIDGLGALGIAPYLDAKVQSPIIAAFHCPAKDWFSFQDFYDRLADRGFVIYPGKLTDAETFRVGCIGDFGPDIMAQVVSAIGAVLEDMSGTMPNEKDPKAA